MTSGQSEKHEAEQTAELCKPWVAPSVQVLRAGSAENISGRAFIDGPLEALGS